MSGIVPGNKFGRLTVVRVLVPSQLWLCKCDCGQWKICRGDALISGNLRSCGCLKDEFLQNSPRKLPYYMHSPIGMKFGSLVVVERFRKSRSRWKCACDCGGEIIATSESLYRGRTTHCDRCGGHYE